MRNFIAFAAAGMMAAAPALAGGMAEPVAQPEPIATPAPAPAAYDWTGFYGGAQLGYGHVGTSGGPASAHGAIGGLHVGYLHDFGKWIAGGELAYDASNAKIGGNGKLNHVARLELKAGPNLGRTFVYGALGVAQAKATFGGASHSDSGYFGGVGLDYALNNQWTLGGEVLTHRFGNMDGTGVDVKPTTAEVRVSYRF